MITQSKLVERLQYDADSGRFTWIASKKMPTGSPAGSLHHSGYVHISIAGRSYTAHRLAWLYMTGHWPVYEIDHLNRNKSDNRFANLRDVPRVLNGRNKDVYATSKTGLSGVYFHPIRLDFQSYVRLEGRMVILGTFDNLLDAAAARKSAEAKLVWHTRAFQLVAELGITARPRSNCSTGVPGVCAQTKGKPFRARINVHKKRLFLGEFDNLFDAVAARRSAENRYWTESSNLSQTS